MPTSDRPRSFLWAVLVIVFVGLLETSFGKQRVQDLYGQIIDPLADVMIAVLLAWPKVWRAPLLIFIEEMVVYAYLIGTDWSVWWWQFTHHWLSQVLPFNPYPWLLAPALTLALEWYMRRHSVPLNTVRT